MMETAMVFDEDGRPIFWHEPPGRSGGYLPDSRSLWDVLWENRARLGGVAHTHPWDGQAYPSGTDVTTFAAVEAGLGKKLLWPVVTFTEVRYYVRNPLTSQYVETDTAFMRTSYLDWIAQMDELRRRSRNGG